MGKESGRSSIPRRFPTKRKMRHMRDNAPHGEVQHPRPDDTRRTTAEFGAEALLLCLSGAGTYPQNVSKIPGRGEANMCLVRSRPQHLVVREYDPISRQSPDGWSSTQTRRTSFSSAKRGQPGTATRERPEYCTGGKPCRGTGVVTSRGYREAGDCTR